MFSQNSAEKGEEERIRLILALLAEYYPEVRTRLRYRNAFELLVATVLSAQTTDEQVNRVTAALFKRAATPYEMAQMEPGELELYIKGCGLYRNKSRFLIECSRVLVEKYHGKVPRDFKSLVALPGVGRKTANVILGNAFNIPALAVDTHVNRVSRRLGLAAGRTAEQVEAELKKKLPVEQWVAAHHRLIAHGRSVCFARKPQCPFCFLAHLCAGVQMQ